jgi:hypothetical protein
MGLTTKKIIGLSTDATIKCSIAINRHFQMEQNPQISNDMNRL